MAYMKCPTCGNKCRFDLETGYVCDCCGNFYSAEDISDTITAKLDYANLKRINDYDFEAALNTCLEILKDEPNNQEANWCALLAEYQIVYLKTTKGDYKPTFIDPDVTTPINKCKYYKRLNVDYKKLADFAEQVRLEVLHESKQIPDYDVFISYKQHVDNSDTIPTEEAEWAAEIYNLLSKTDLRVFYDEVSLKNGNAGWEPHIYSALKSSRYLILLGSSLENINSTWVKNEWKRFIACRKKDSDKTFSVVGKNINPEEIDYDLQSKQMLSADDTEWVNSLIKNVTDYFVKYKIDFYLKEGESYILKRKFKKAKQCYAKVCSADQRNVKAYWGLLYCKFKAMDDYDLVKSRKKIGNTSEYKNIMKYASEEEKEVYRKVCKDNLIRNKSSYDRSNYYYWKRKYRTQRFVKKVGIFSAILAACAFGVYTYFGITQPVRYSVKYGEATLTGKSIYFNLLVSDLKVDTYKDLPVTKIGDGALKNTNIKSVSLADSVNEIGKNAFEDCKYLNSIDIGKCSYIGSEAFKGCTSLTEIKIGITDDTLIEADAFTNIGQNAIIYVPTVAQELTSQLKTYYTSINFVLYTRDKVEECEYFISKLSKISPDSGSKIEEAETLYNNLSYDEKKMLSNYGTLQNAKTAYRVATTINEIGEITLNNEKKIIEAENSYRSLTIEQKNMVANYNDLLTARAVFNTMSLIDKIGDVTINSEQKIVKAEEAYLALNYEQRDLVSNYSSLVSARTKVDMLIANVAIDKISQIDSIITLNSEEKIINAESYYNELTESQKNRVFNYNVLADARAVYNTIKAIDNIKTITINSEVTIKTAQNLYNGLTPAQKNRVINYSDLIDATAVYPVVVKIGSIGNVFVNSGKEIEAAETAYAKLSAAQQSKVSNYDNLKDLRAAYNTVLLIDKIGEKIDENSIEIEEAQTSYDNLTANQKKIVGNYNKLDNANKIYKTIKAIYEIGEVHLNSSSQIYKAESSYYDLTIEQKQKIYNYEKLKSSRAIYNVLVIIDKQDTVRFGKGQDYSYQTLTMSNASTVLNNESFRNEIDSITFNDYIEFNNQDYLCDAFLHLKLVRFDIKDGTIIDGYCFTPSKLTYRIIGTTNAYNISFSAHKGNELNIEFENFKFESTAIPLDLSNISKSKVTFIGECSIKTNKIGSEVVKSNDITISLNSGTNTTITAASAGIGINASNLSIISSGESSSLFTVKAGNSASGVKGSDGVAGKNGGNGEDGTNGTNGNKGSNGANGVCAVNAYSLNINAKNAHITLIGGNGGNGGNGGSGGAGGKAGDVGWFIATGNTRIAGKGGNGGNGGNGGTGGNAVVVSHTFVISSGWCTLRGGNGGNAGKGGSGGTGGNGGMNTWTAGGGGVGAKGGNGGDGGNAGTGGLSCNRSISKSSSVNLECINGNTGTKGLGGAGGEGGIGEGGSPNGSKGYSGASGKGN